VSGWGSARLALFAERQRTPDADPFSRNAIVALLQTTQRQRDQDIHYEETFAALGEAGSTQNGRYARHRLLANFGAALRTNALSTLEASWGRIGGTGRESERFVVGGIASPLIDPMLDARRIEAPAYPLGSAVGDNFLAYRAGLPLGLVDLYYSGVSTDVFAHALRSYGVELGQELPAIPALGTPELRVLTGVARAVDEPVKGQWRYYVTLSLKP
jgi:hypothetical protein